LAGHLRLGGIGDSWVEEVWRKCNEVLNCSTSTMVSKVRLCFNYYNRLMSTAHLVTKNKNFDDR
jgi:hypothetical protein